MVAPLKPSSPVMARGWLPATFLKDNYQAVNSLLTPSESKVNVGKFFFQLLAKDAGFVMDPTASGSTSLAPTPRFQPDHDLART
jgi:hypothetical protein